ncbi:putative monooxygenase [Nocardia nova SH22a]|uniref:Putative monooxygenase n=1 Tax=Nocardia nova SH22a TaxID=1415166 RepID=W5TS21_9NOCA|nr:FAD-dependent monooxygenase [Nocardia nova]AHH21939.1 putative monooxygenase [Nocardia nova SH22a]
MITTEVVIAGSGPTGLMLARELRLAGIEVEILDALPARTGESRAGGIHARSMELLDQRGLLDGLLAQGRRIDSGHFGGIPLDFGDFPTRYPFTLAVLQSRIEAELDSAATAHGAATQWDSPVIGVRDDADGVLVDVGGSRPRQIRARYLVGCDGGRSAVRKLAGIGFDGTEATLTGMLADVELAEPPAESFFGTRGSTGDFSAIQFEPGWYRLMAQCHDRVLPRGTELTFEQFRTAFTELAGTDFGMHSPRWVTHYSDAARQAQRYRAGRVFLAGDAAHIHYPAGGQGQNLGLQDAANLGWKLAAVLRGDAADALLDTYESERHPVAARVLQNTRAQTALQRPGPHADALRDSMSDLIGTDAVRHRLGLMITALDIRYDCAGDHPMTGRRVPDADLTTADGPVRMYELLRPAHPILLVRNGVDAPDIGPWKDRVEVVCAADSADEWTVPGIGTVTAPAYSLVRPDGYIAWAANDAGTAGLTAALTTWVGGGR